MPFFWAKAFNANTHNVIVNTIFFMSIIVKIHLGIRLVLVRVYSLVQSSVIIMQIFMFIHILISGVPVVQMSTASLHI